MEAIEPLNSMQEALAGRGFLRFEKVAGKNSLTEVFAKSPLKLLTPNNGGRTPWVYSSSFGGGFVGGDAVDLRIQVLREAEAVLMSQASTKVFRSIKPSHQFIEAHLEEGGVLYSIPDPVVCFADAKFCQKQKFHLQEGASLLVTDTLHCGREHSGERWRFESYGSEIQIFRGGKRIFLESLLLNSTPGPLVKRFSKFNALSLILMTGPAFKVPTEKILEMLKVLSPGAQEDFVISASRLGLDGVVLRMAAVSTEVLAAAQKEILAFLPEHLGDDPWARKW
jgi:urease accessory protein